MKKIVSLLFCCISLFLVSCSFSSANSTPADTLAYHEEKTPYENNFSRYADSLEKYGTLMDYFICDDSKDTVFLCQENDHKQYHVIKYSEDTQVSEESILIFPKDTFLLSVRLSPDGYLLLFDSVTAYVYPPGSENYTASFPAISKYGMIFPENETVICRSYLDSGYFVYDLKSGKNTGVYLEKDFLFHPNYKDHTLLCDSDGTYLLITGNGLYEKESDTWILKIPSEKTSMYLSSFAPVKAEKTGEQEYSVFESDCCYHYSPDEEGTAYQEITNIKIVSLIETPFLKDIIVEYQIQHPELSLSYEFLCSEPPASPQAYNVLLQKMNAGMTAKDAGDIYLLDYLPWETYAEKGFLMNLEESFSSYLNNEDYFGQVILACCIPKGQFVLPLSFETDFILCREDFAPSVSKLHELAGYLAQNPDESGLVPYYYKENPAFFLAMVYHYYQNELYENGTVTQKSIEQFLTDAKMLYDRLSFPADANIASYQQTYFENEHYHYVFDELWPMLEQGNCNICFYPGTLTNACSMQQCWKVKSGFVLVPAGTFHPSRLFGIHAASLNKEESANFLNYLLSYYETHSFTSGNLSIVNVHEGVSVYKPVIADWLSLYADVAAERYDAQQNFYYDNNYGNSYPIYLPDNGDIQIISALFENADTRLSNANFRYNPVYALLKEQGLPYLEEKVSLQQAANNLYSGLSLMQSEK